MGERLILMKVRVVVGVNLIVSRVESSHVTNYGILRDASLLLGINFLPYINASVCVWGKQKFISNGIQGRVLMLLIMSWGNYEGVAMLIKWNSPLLLSSPCQTERYSWISFKAWLLLVVH